jgi:hypothetical protein
MTGNDRCAGNLISRDDSVLVAIDVQEKLMPVMANQEKHLTSSGHVSRRFTTTNNILRGRPSPEEAARC